MNDKYIFVGNGKQEWILRELFWAIINGKVENASYIEPYYFPSESIEKEYWREYSSENAKYITSITAPKWRMYSSLINIPIGDEKVYFFFIYGREVDRLHDPVLLKQLKEMHGDRIILCLLLFDSINVTRDYHGWGKITQCFSSFDEVATFDLEDSKKYNLIYFKTPYTKRTCENSIEIISDIFFIGDEKGRGPILSDISTLCQKHEVIADFRLMNAIDNNDISADITRLTKLVPYDETLKLINATNCLLEIVSPGQSSNSLRYYEAITYNKKLLSNNKKVLESAYYKTGYIKYFENVNDIDFEWIRNKENVDYGYNNEYCEKQWLSELVDKINSRNNHISIERDRKVSVVIPVYNREKTIVDAVRSVLEQTYKELECIVVDDGSTDETVSVLKNSITDSRLKIYTKANSGACATRNYGVEKSTGKYIAFQDSDDLWLPDKLEKQVRILEKNNDIDVVFCNAIRIGFEDREEEILLKEIEDGIVSRRMLQSRSMVSTQTILARKECFFFEKFDPALPRLQDYDLVIRLAEAFRFYYISTPLVLINVQEDSISSNPQKAIDARRIILKKYPNIILRNIDMYASSIASIRHNSALLNIEDADADREWQMIKKIRDLNKRINEQRDDVDRVYNSFSWKIGRLITFIPRKMRQFVKNKIRLKFE